MASAVRRKRRATAFVRQDWRRTPVSVEESSTEAPVREAGPRQPTSRRRGRGSSRRRSQLHGTVGPARTTVSAIAENAGVRRATVYHQLPRRAGAEARLLRHVGGAQSPTRRGDVDASSTTPSARLDGGIGGALRWYEWVEPMLSAVLRDIEAMPIIADAPGAAIRATSLRSRTASRRPGSRRTRGYAPRSGSSWTSSPGGRDRSGGQPSTDAIAVMASAVRAAAT